MGTTVDIAASAPCQSMEGHMDEKCDAHAIASPCIETTSYPNTESTVYENEVRKTTEGCSCKQQWTDVMEVGAQEITVSDYCANPDNDEKGEWCMVQDETCQGEKWGYCAPKRMATLVPQICPNAHHFIALTAYPKILCMICNQPTPTEDTHGGIMAYSGKLTFGPNQFAGRQADESYVSGYAVYGASLEGALVTSRLAFLPKKRASVVFDARHDENCCQHDEYEIELAGVDLTGAEKIAIVVTDIYGTDMPTGQLVSFSDFTTTTTTQSSTTTTTSSSTTLTTTTVEVRWTAQTTWEVTYNSNTEAIAAAGKDGKCCDAGFISF